MAPKDFPDANPNAVLYSQGHRSVVDAGASTLAEVKPNGEARVIAFFPVPKGSQSDAVPTRVARGPDGALYVGELLGGFYAPGHARIWRVAPGHARWQGLRRQPQHRPGERDSAAPVPGRWPVVRIG